MPIKELSAADDARHVLDPARALMRESLVWVVPLPAQGLGLVAYTWVDAFGKAGTAGIAFGPSLRSPIFERVDDIAVPDDMTFDGWKAGPIHVAHPEPLRSAVIGYAGERFSMDFTFEAVHPPYAYSSHAEPFPLWYADDRFEQGGRARGTARLDDQEVSFEGFGHRDHSWGARAWGGTLHYKWINFLAEDTSVHVMDLHGWGHTWPRGDVHKDGHTAEIVQSSFDYELDDDFYHRRFAARFTDDAGRTTEVRLLDSTAEIDYPISPRLTLFDIVGPGTIDGVEGACYAEMAWPPDYLAANVEIDTGGRA